MGKDSDIFQTIIKSYEDKRNIGQPKNSVIKQYKDHGIQWPNSETNQINNPAAQMFPYPGPGYGWSFPSFPMAVQQQPFYTGGLTAVATPPPPPEAETLPPLPGSEEQD